jgi:hypothetical protein
LAVRYIPKDVLRGKISEMGEYVAPPMNRDAQYIRHPNFARFVSQALGAPSGKSSWIPRHPLAVQKGNCRSRGGGVQGFILRKVFLLALRRFARSAFLVVSVGCCFLEGSFQDMESSPVGLGSWGRGWEVEWRALWRARRASKESSLVMALDEEEVTIISGRALVDGVLGISFF